jgi:hypothetical protein
MGFLPVPLSRRDGDPQCICLSIHAAAGKPRPTRKAHPFGGVNANQRSKTSVDGFHYRCSDPSGFHKASNVEKASMRRTESTINATPVLTKEQG